MNVNFYPVSLTSMMYVELQKILSFEVFRERKNNISHFEYFPSPLKKGDLSFSSPNGVSIKDYFYRLRIYNCEEYSACK